PNPAMLPTKHMSHQIIYLNGPSSAGKTTLGRALQRALPEPFLLLCMDMLVDAMPPQLNDWTGQQKTDGYSYVSVPTASGEPMFQLCIGPFAQRLQPALQQIIIVLAAQGFNLIIDDVAFGKAQVDLYREALKEYQVLWVGIKVSLEVLEAREKTRGDRLIGSARDQAEKVHRDVVYDLELDTSRMAVEEAVNQVLSRW
ncbi:MAG TPA: AAA family ATPase, partial [Anaerolineae bacterium]